MASPAKPKAQLPQGRKVAAGTSSLVAAPPQFLVYQGQEVQFTATGWTPLAPALAQPPTPVPTYNVSWTIKPTGQTPTTYTYNNVVPDAFDATQPTATFTWDTTDVEPGSYTVSAAVTDQNNNSVSGFNLTPNLLTVKLRPIASGDTLPVTMLRAAEEPTSDEALWVAIRFSSNQLLFQNYLQFVDSIMCNNTGATSIDDILNNSVNQAPCLLPPISQRRFVPFPNMDAYRVLKVATECFLMLNCGVYLNTATLTTLVNSQPIPPPMAKPTAGQPFPPVGYDVTDDANRLNQSPMNLPSQIINWWSMYLQSGNQYLNPNDNLNDKIIPYLALVRSRLSEVKVSGFCDMGVECYSILRRKLTNPCLVELIWSYWHEEAMLAQTLNVISRRFQNLRGNGGPDPLVRFDIDPLRRLNSFLWGYIQDEQHRLSVVRRAYEYNHEYGLSLEGKAVRALRPSDSRSKFLEAFHNLLYLCTIFFKEDDDTTVVADGFPLLNALREVHYILAAGAHNQFGELPSTARQEMLMQQWLLARPEMREFLGGKIMVPYPEEWMDRVDTVKTMEGWTDVSVVHFHDLAVFGEQVVLSIRYGAWSLTTATAAQAANWARYWRNEIQGYIHAYRAVTSVDLTADVADIQEAARRYTVPSVLLRQRLATQVRH
jgi:hypothetical protein